MSTITNHSSKPLLVWFMLMAGTGAGGVNDLSFVPKPRCRDLLEAWTLQTTMVAEKASVPRRDTSVVTAVCNVSVRELSEPASVSLYVILARKIAWGHFWSSN